MVKVCEECLIQMVKSKEPIYFEDTRDGKVTSNVLTNIPHYKCDKCGKVYLTQSQVNKAFKVMYKED
jgi:hypothetical protein